MHTREAEQQLRLRLGAPVRIVRARKGGRIEIDFKSEDELQRMYEMLTDGGQSGADGGQSGLTRVMSDLVRGQSAVTGVNRAQPRSFGQSRLNRRPR